MSRKPLLPVFFDFLSPFSLGGELRDLTQVFEVLPGGCQIYKPAVSENSAAAESRTEVLTKKSLVISSCVEQRDEPPRWWIVNDLAQDNPATSL
jgi:hypothetical protein